MALYSKVESFSAWDSFQGYEQSECGDCVKEYCFSDLFEIYNKVLNVALIVWEWSIGVKPQTERWNLVIVLIVPDNSSLFNLKI